MTKEQRKTLEIIANPDYSVLAAKGSEAVQAVLAERDALLKTCKRALDVFGNDIVSERLTAEDSRRLAVIFELTSVIKQVEGG